MTASTQMSMEGVALRPKALHHGLQQRPPDTLALMLLDEIQGVQFALEFAIAVAFGATRGESDDLAFHLGDEDEGPAVRVAQAARPISLAILDRCAIEEFVGHDTPVGREPTGDMHFRDRAHVVARRETEGKRHDVGPYLTVTVIRCISGKIQLWDDELPGGAAGGTVGGVLGGVFGGALGGTPGVDGLMDGAGLGTGGAGGVEGEGAGGVGADGVFTAGAAGTDGLGVSGT
ncbi:MAG TPA: hypothetical protein VMT34_00175, partial [Aggregatilineales bacterium]|nr:hypothetical protein [Aggregatilineales bacterium]